MEEQKQDQLLETLQKAYPRYKFSLLSTMQRSAVMLLLVKGTSTDLNNWGFSNGSNVWWNTILPTAKKLGVLGEIRTLFVISDEAFVLYAPALGIKGGVFGDFKEPIELEAYGNEYHRYYVGKCRSVSNVIRYLQKKKRPF